MAALHVFFTQQRFLTDVTNDPSPASANWLGEGVVSTQFIKKFVYSQPLFVT